MAEDGGLVSTGGRTGQFRGETEGKRPTIAIRYGSNDRRICLSFPLINKSQESIRAWFGAPDGPRTINGFFAGVDSGPWNESQEDFYSRESLGLQQMSSPVPSFLFISVDYVPNYLTGRHVHMGFERILTLENRTAEVKWPCYESLLTVHKEVPTHNHSPMKTKLNKKKE